jgi:hypothetical protein
MLERMEDPSNEQFERYSIKRKTPVNKATLDAIDAHYGGKLTAWKTRHQKAIKEHPSNKEHFHIAVTQLYESHKVGQPDALPFLDKLLACEAKTPCGQVFCPVCRSKKQDAKSKDALAAFSKLPHNDLYFMTLLVRVVQDAEDVEKTINQLRNRLRAKLHNNRAGLGINNSPLKIMGAFEVDLKNLYTQSEASKNSQELIKSLGFDPKHFKPQYLVHLHAIVGPLDADRKRRLRSIIAEALGADTLLPDQIRFSSLHSSKKIDENLDYLARYMYKARLQFADNVYENGEMNKRARFHTPFMGKVLVDYLKSLQKNKHFQGLKFEHGL